MSLEAHQFIGRFLRHVLPLGFYKIRYFGILAQSNAKTKTAWCFDLIDNEAFLPSMEGVPATEIYRTISGKDSLLCPLCKKGKMIPVVEKPVISRSPG